MTFVERHRPRSVQDLVFADPTVAAIIDRYAYRRPTKPLLLYGAPGTGKSKAIFNKILNMAQIQMWPRGTPAIIVIDEIDEFEDKLPGKTRTFVEQHKSVQLLASTNYIKKIKPALQSRMRCVEVKKPSNADWVPRAHAILTAEGATVSHNDVQQLMQNFTGDARDFIDYLEEQVDTARYLNGAGGSQVRRSASSAPHAVGGTL
jgi:replication factor C subunit 3/5